VSRILIVDDVPASREALVRILRQEGYEVSSARNGAEGLVRLKDKKPDLVLLDNMMPEVDGLTFLAGIRRFPKWKNLPVIMFTGLQEKTAQQRAQGLGVKEYLLKAKYSIPELLEMVRKHVPPGKGPERSRAAASEPSEQKTSDSEEGRAPASRPQLAR
jgi:CheY-like chemotaxis protein